MTTPAPFDTSAWEQSEHSLSLSWLISQPELGLDALTDLPAPTFSAVHPCELLDPTPFVRPGVVLLLTGIAFQDFSDATPLVDYVHRVKEAGVVGIGFGVGVVFPEVPAEIHAAEEAGLFLFSVPLPVPFISVLDATREELSRRRIEEHQRLQVAQHSLNEAAMLGEEALLDRARRVLKSSIAVMDSAGKVMSASWLDGGAETEREDLIQQLSDGAKRGFGAARRVGSHHVLSVSMGTQGQSRRGLVAVNVQPFTSHDRALLRHCAGLAELLEQRSVHLRGEQQRLYSLALSIVLSRTRSSSVELSELSTVFQGVADARGLVRPVLLASKMVRTHARAMGQLEEKLDRAGLALCSVDTRETASLILLPGTWTVEQVMVTVDSVRESCRIAIGAPLAWEELDSVVLSALDKACLSIEPGDIVRPQTQPVTWLAEGQENPALDHRRDHTWGALRRHDAVAGDHLATTLEVFLRNSGNVSRTASYLEVHRQTVRTRLRDIERVIEVDLNDPVTVAELTLLSLQQG